MMCFHYFGQVVEDVVLINQSSLVYLCVRCNPSYPLELLVALESLEKEFLFIVFLIIQWNSILSITVLLLILEIFIHLTFIDLIHLPELLVARPEPLVLLSALTRASGYGTIASVATPII